MSVTAEVCNILQLREGIACNKSVYFVKYNMLQIQEKWRPTN